MNCANHPDRERVAFCQNCGKPLCQECVRNYGTAILCEPCLALRTAGPAYGAGPVPPVGGPIPPVGAVRAVPNPILAGLLGFIPGVGAMYNEQYAKGIVHLIVFAILVSLASDVNGIFGLFIAGWVFYMVFEAYQTARAKRFGMPVPNPFGLNDIGERFGFGRAWPSAAAPTVPPTAGFYPTEGPQQPYAAANPYAPPASHWGAPQETYGSQANYAPPPPNYGPAPGYVPPSGFVPPTPVEPIPPVDPTVPMYKRVPTGAIWLIGLGIFFLLTNAGLHIISGRLLVPFVLIGVGVGCFVKRMTATGHGLENDGTDFYRWRLAHALNCGGWLVLVGVVMLVDALHILHWGQSWPIFLIGAGILLMLRHSLMSGYVPPLPPSPYPAHPAPAPPAPPVTTTDIVRSTNVPSSEAGSDTQEGR